MRCEIAKEARSAELAIINAHKISRILPDFICKNNRFSACFNFEQTRTITIFGEHGFSGALARASRARSGAPWVRKFGKLSISRLLRLLYIMRLLPH